MASIASAAPLAFNREPTSNSNLAKRKRNGTHHDQDVPHPQPAVNPSKRSQDGGLQPTVSRGRRPSLRHVKNSNEVLRERSVKKANLDVVDSTPVGREGRQFTVANVGNNGKIYLR